MAKHRRSMAGVGTNMSLANVASNDIAETVSNAYYWFNFPKVKDDEEVAERLNMFFAHCAETGELPTVEKMCLSLGSYYHEVNRWQREDGASPERAEMIRKAKEIIAAMDAELASKQKISPVVYIFRSKNFYGMRDQVETITTINKIEAESPEALSARYANAMDAEFEDK